ncbi:MAG TPA: hypothetical protein VIL21_07985, partial [Solirubrobacterales bacterium]
MPDQSNTQPGANGGSAAGRIALKVSQLHADLLSTLHEEISTNGNDFAQAAERLAAEFGSVTAAAVEALDGSG